MILLDYKTIMLCFVPSAPMFVVRKQNDGNSKLIISVFLSTLPVLDKRPNHLVKISQVQFMSSMSWTLRRSKTMI